LRGSREGKAAAPWWEKEMDIVLEIHAFEDF